jgi:hypothetical protein
MMDFARLQGRRRRNKIQPESIDFLTGSAPISGAEMRRKSLRLSHRGCLRFSRGRLHLIAAPAFLKNRSTSVKVIR